MLCMPCTESSWLISTPLITWRIRILEVGIISKEYFQNQHKSLVSLRKYWLNNENEAWTDYCVVLFPYMIWCGKNECRGRERGSSGGFFVCVCACVRMCVCVCVVKQRKFSYWVEKTQAWNIFVIHFARIVCCSVLTCCGQIIIYQY